MVQSIGEVFEEGNTPLKKHNFPKKLFLKHQRLYTPAVNTRLVPILAHFQGFLTVILHLIYEQPFIVQVYCPGASIALTLYLQ